MQAKIIEVIEVTEFVEEPMFGEQGGSVVSRPKRKYFLRDGTPIYDICASVPLPDGITVTPLSDGTFAVGGSTFGSN